MSRSPVIQFIVEESCTEEMSCTISLCFGIYEPVFCSYRNQNIDVPGFLSCVQQFRSNISFLFFKIPTNVGLHGAFINSCVYQSEIIHGNISLSILTIFIPYFASLFGLNIVKLQQRGLCNT